MVRVSITPITGVSFSIRWKHIVFSSICNNLSFVQHANAFVILSNTNSIGYFRLSRLYKAKMHEYIVQFYSIWFLSSGSSWLFVTPFGLRKVLNWIKMTYNNIPVYITENGVSDRNGSLVDYNRVYFYRNYINEVLKGKAILALTNLTDVGSQPVKLLLVSFFLILCSC